MTEERRKHIRQDHVYKIIYATSENPRKKVSTTSFNISLGGIGIKLRDLIKESKELCLWIYSSHNNEPVEAKGRLVWQSYLPNYDYDENRAGIKFIEIPWTRIKSILS